LKILKIVIIALLAIIILLAVVPLLIPVPPLQGLVPVSQLADPDSKFIQIEGVNFHYKEAGSGKPALVLLHGFGASVYSWREVLQPLSDYGQTIAYDRPAFGLTDRPMPGDWSGESPYGLSAQARMLVELLDKKGIDRAILVGNSAGGTLAVFTALNYPARVQALILVDPAVYSSGPAFPNWLRPLLETPQARRIGPLLVRSIQETGMEILVKAWNDPSKITDEIRSNYRKPLQIANWDRALYELTIASAPSHIAERLQELQLPVLVMTGDNDQIVPTEQSLRLAKEIPSAKLAVIPACGHVPQEECPQAFMQAAGDFIDGLAKLNKEH
jgi:pimeloyl-ACP methyl ester carboxylesterase